MISDAWSRAGNNGTCLLPTAVTFFGSDFIFLLRSFHIRNNGATHVYREQYKESFETRQFPKA